MTFSPARLRGHRNGRGLHLKELALAARCSPTRLREIEIGAEPTPGEIEALSDALSVSATEFEATSDSITDYADAVAYHDRPMTDAEVAQAALLLRRRGGDSPAHARTG